ncbi:MAG: endonuclease/exonuclease/phosphatase family protein, partial [Bacteroidia bacterium]
MPSAGYEQVAFVFLLINAAYLIFQVFPFTIFGKKQIITARKPIGNANLSLLIANVYQDNRQSDKYLKLIKDCDPDVILMVETN